MIAIYATAAEVARMVEKELRPPLICNNRTPDLRRHSAADPTGRTIATRKRRGRWATMP